MFDSSLLTQSRLCFKYKIPNIPPKQLYVGSEKYQKWNFSQLFYIANNFIMSL